MRTRFAPSPTGPLHLGHAFSALVAWDMVQAAGGAFFLRIEDIDTNRSKPEFEAAIYDDLHWLGLRWPQPVLRQSTQFDRYRAALAGLRERGLVYPCTCTRRDIAEAASAPQEGIDGGIVYPGTCRGRRDNPAEAAWRLDMRAAIAALGGAAEVARLVWRETAPEAEHALDADLLVESYGDIVLARRDIGASYHLSVVLDDDFQGITHVIRGQDLRDATPIHRLLQALLGLDVPMWHHHGLIRDEAGKRLAKRDDARALAVYRDAGANPQDIRTMVGLSS